MSGLFFLPNKGLALTFSPTKIEQNIAAGSIVTTKARIYNEKDVSIVVSAETAAVVSKDDSGTVEVLPATPNSNTLTTWIDTGLPFTLASHTWIDVPLVIHIPIAAEPGTYAAVVLFTATSEKVSEGGVELITKTGPVVIVTVPGDVKREAKFLGFSIIDKTLFGKNVFDRTPTQFQIRVQNTGTVSFVPTGTVVIRNLFGQVVRRLVVNSENRLVLPGWQRSFSINTHNQERQEGITGEWKPFALGRYTADLELSMDNNVIKQKITYWVFPWHTVLTGVGVLVLLGILGWVTRRLRG